MCMVEFHTVTIQNGFFLHSIKSVLLPSVQYNR